jgi:8-oxo-dGTP diphosphatase
LAMPLEMKVDRYRGVTILPESVPSEPASFAEELDSSLDQWRAEGYRLAWLELPISKADLIPIATARGFSFHHCGTEILMLTKRLSDDSFVPPFASHYLGAGGVVISPEGELLTVVERYGPTFHKLPGGLVEAGEEIADGVKREVMEETGVETEFKSLVAMGHAPSWLFAKPSLYVVCTLRPLSREIVIDESEIAEARWMPVDEFLASEHASDFTKKVLRVALSSEGLGAYRFPRRMGGSDWELYLPSVERGREG